MKKLFLLAALCFGFLSNDSFIGEIKSACADGPYCAQNTFKCRNRYDDGFVCCSSVDNSRCCHYKGSGDAYCA